MNADVVGLVLLILIAASIGLVHLASKAIYGPTDKMRDALNRSIIRRLGVGARTHSQRLSGH